MGLCSQGAANLRAALSLATLNLMTEVLIKNHCCIGLFAIIQICQNFLTLVVFSRNRSVKSIKYPLSKEVVQSLRHVQLFAIPWTAARQASLSFTISRSLHNLMSIESVMLFSHLILCHLLLLPSIFPSIRVFSNESSLCIRWPKYWSFIFSISPSNEYPGLISFRMDWFDLLAVQGTLKNLLQHHGSKASIL